MDSKLTLKLRKEIIEKAKEYAAAQNKSLSRLVEAYLKALIEKNPDNEGDTEITPFVKSFSTGVNIPSELDAREEYRKHLSEKHK
jgi:hypothetical protein